MTGAAMESRRGETRVRERFRRRLRRAAIVCGATTLVMTSAPFIADFVEGPARRHVGGETSAAEAIATVLALAGVVVAAGVWGWRESDELQRRRAVNVWAAIGFVGFVGHPLARHLAQVAAFPSSQDALWHGSLAAGVAVFLYQKIRG